MDRRESIGRGKQKELDGCEDDGDNEGRASRDTSFTKRRPSYDAKVQFPAQDLATVSALPALGSVFFDEAVGGGGDDGDRMTQGSRRGGSHAGTSIGRSSSAADSDEILDEEVESQETSNVTAQSNGLGDLCMLQHLLLRVMAIDVPGSA